MAKKAKRSAAQIAATRKLIAFNRARARSKSRPARSAAARPAPKRRASRTTPVATPRRRRKWRISSARAASAAGRVLRYRRPNPIGNFVKDTLMPSVVGGAGALALDVAIGMLPLPPALKTGPMAPLVKAAGAVGVGMLAGQLMGRRVGEQVAAGGLTVTVYNVARQMLVQATGGKIPGLAEYVSMYPGDMAEYVDYSPPQLGYQSSGGQVGEAELEGYETGVYR